MAKGILAVGLFQEGSIPNSEGGHQPHNWLRYNGSIAVGLGPLDWVFVTKGNNS
jgi:hypothetical protein